MEVENLEASHSASINGPTKVPPPDSDSYTSSLETVPTPPIDSVSLEGPLPPQAPPLAPSVVPMPQFELKIDSSALQHILAGFFESFNAKIAQQVSSIAAARCSIDGVGCRRR